MLGAIQLEEFNGLTSMPQKAASAWNALEGIVGASYKPLMYLGTQIVRGVNYWFIAEQTLVTAAPERHVVKLAINEFNGVFSLIPYTIEVVA